MRIVITGSEGLIGSALSKELIKQGHKVIRTDIIRKVEPNYVMADITYYETLSRVFRDEPDVVFHLGAEVSRLTSEQCPSVAINKNINGVWNIIIWCLATGSKLILSGTSESYGDIYDKGIVAKEDIPRAECNNMYALTKLMGEDLIRYYNRQYGLKAVIARIFMCYGQEEANGYKSAITRFIDGALRNDVLEVHKGTGRAWCYIDDTVSGLIALMKDDGTKCETYNIGNDEYILTEDLARMIIELSDSKSKINLIDQPRQMTPHKKADFTKMRERLGWSAKIPLKDGLEKSVIWHKQNLKLR